MKDKAKNFGRPPANATDTPGVPVVADHATFQPELDKRRSREKTQTWEGDAIAAASRRTPTLLLHGRTKVRTNEVLSTGSTTALALQSICSRSEDRPSMFNKAERSTVTSGDAPSELDRVAHPLDELANALACSSSPQWEAARCRHTAGTATALFFSDDIGDINEAKRICSGCPMAVPCVEGALDRHEPCGVWGGYLFANGQILAHKRPRGRPPKNRPTPSTTQLVVGRRAHERSRSV